MSSYPYAPDEVLAAMQNQALNNSIYTGTSKVIGAINDTTRFINSEITGVSKDIAQTSLGLRDAIERGNAGGMATTERVGANLSTAVERNGNATQVTSERIGGNVMTAIEKVAGEGRLTTTIVDAASRQAANDSARDILRAVDKNGTESIGVTKDTYTGLLGSIERNSGENRVQTLISSGVTDAKLTDVRHSILTDVNRVGNELSGQSTQSLNVLTKHVTDAAWEGRSALANGFQNLGEEHLRTKAELAHQASINHSSQLLENQKLGARSADH
jgi:hypothetical protein